ncbi:MAG: sodium:solute symporter family protein [Bacteroidia bacterium]
MIGAAVLGYLGVTLVIGIVAARKVKNTQDFLLAGRRLSLPLTTSAFFATWFGAETILGASHAFAHQGLLGVIEDPFGSALCLFLAGFWLAGKLYPLRIQTLGDFYRDRFGKSVEKVSSFFMVISYVGWIAAQYVALGILLQKLFGGSLRLWIGVGAALSTFYTFLGGLWSVAILDLIQNGIIVLGLIGVALSLHGWEYVWHQTPATHWNFFPPNDVVSWLNYFAAWIAIGWGSLPQQDIYQRIASAKNLATAQWGSYLAAAAYLLIGFVPLALGLYMHTYHPQAQGDQGILLSLIARYTPPGMQLIFYGALISAILSSSSGGTLAPAAILSENLFPWQRIPSLWRARLSVLVIGLVCLLMSWENHNIYQLVGESSALSLVCLFVPLVVGLYGRPGKGLPALLSMVAGFAAWVVALYLQTTLHPLLWGLGASVGGYLAGQVIGTGRKPTWAKWAVGRNVGR